MPTIYSLFSYRIKRLKRPGGHHVLLTALMLLATMSSTSAFATEQCFHLPGTYGALTVTRSGVCGQTLTYGGITGEWMGQGSSSSTCTWTMTPASGSIDPATFTIRMTAHSNVSGNLEEARFLLNGSQYLVENSDIDNSFPTGGSDLIATAVGDVAPVAGDGRGTISFTRFVDGITTAQIDHNRITASPNGTIYQLCADDQGLVPVTVDELLTNDNQPVLTGTYDPANNTLLTVTVNGTTYVQGAANSPLVLNANGTWSLDLSATPQIIPDGTFDVIATSSDGANTATDDTTNELTVDATAPVITTTAPVDGSSTNDTTPALVGTGEPGTDVTLVLTDGGGNPVQTIVVTPDASGNWSIDAAVLAEGPYTLTATSVDDFGNAATPVTTIFDIDLTAPAVDLVTPADGSSSNDPTPTISGTAEPGSTLTVVITDANGVVQTLNPTNNNGDWSIDAAALPEGDYTVVVTATDDAGNTATDGPSGFNIDSTPPTIALGSPADGSFTNDTTPLLAGTSEPGSAVVVEIRDANGALVQTVVMTPNAAGDFNAETPVVLPDGTYTAVAIATDAVGNTAADTHTFTVDTVEPVVTIVEPADLSSTNNTTPTISGTSDSPTDVIVTVTNDDGMVIFTETVPVDAQGNWTLVTPTPLDEDTYIVEASSLDQAGNGGSTTSTFDIDLTAPALEITAPADDEVIAVRDVDVVGVTEPSTEVIVELKDDQGMIVDTQTVVSDVNGDWTVTFQGVANGEYDAEAASTDDAGNTATDTQGFSVDSDEPNLTVINPEDNATLNDSTPGIDGTTDPDATVTVVITDDQGTEVETLTVTPNPDGTWSTEPTTDLADGDYTVSTTATRPNGKSTTVDRDITIDTSVPTVVISSPVDGSTTNETAVVVTGTTEPGATVEVTITDDADMVVFTGAATADDQGAFSVDAGMLTDGEFTVAAVATDAAGNAGDAQNDFTIDTSAPTLTIASPATGDAIEDTTPTVTGTADPGATVEVFVDGQSIGTVVADDQGQWSIDVTQPLDEGDHTVEAKTTNDAGTEFATGEVPFTVETPGDDVVITSPTDGSEVTGPSVVVTGTGTPGSQVEVTIGDQTQVVTVDENGDWTATLDPVPAGDATITATSEGKTSTVDVTVINPTPDLLLAGGACENSVTGTTTPVSNFVLMLLAFGAVFGLRRRRR